MSILEADHARIVAEATAEARAAERRHWEARFRNAEEAHTAALAGRNAETPIRGEHDPLCFPAIRDVRMGDWGPSCFTCQVIGMARVVAPRTLTADDPGYHSQRCLHCDHIRATHTLTAHGCIGHALPGRPGADCPCAEFIHDGEAT